MLYKKNSQKKLDDSLFQAPTAEYRGTPFWSWNTKLDKDELLWQIEALKEMGFGGFHMHSRAGMATEYLSNDFMDLVKTCNEKAKSEGMLTWLYDEDRWPSGFAGGYVTKNPKYRQKFLLFTVNPIVDAADPVTGYETGKPYLLACYDVCLREDGVLDSYSRILEETEAKGTKWYVYVSTPELSGRFNGQTYVDTLSKEAIAEFIRITYNAYLDAVGDDFGKNIPSIFTDEPQFCAKETLPFAESKRDIKLPYTIDFADTFSAKYGIDLLQYLPELLWDLPNGAPSKVRYFYHDHVCDRFTEAFADQCGKWCREHGIALTGHMLNEDSLYSQARSLGEAMRAYRSFGIPGIDTLCDDTLFTTAKQCQSAVHQYGREAMLSELYGVSGWDFDFRGHKYQGDWQAALGVTVRVPHLSWVSMKGSAKRDYPASIHYQSAWYCEYPYIENHFARVNTAMTRGKPSVKVAVIHPVESYWLHYGPEENTAAIRKQLQDNFQSVTEWLLYGTIDFDFVSESLLPSQNRDTHNAALCVGEMEYSAVIVPGMETMRSSTCEILEAFLAKGGKLIFMGDCPRYVDAEPSDCVKSLYERSAVIPFSSLSLMRALEDEREVLIREESGVLTDNLIYQMRNDEDCKWLFVASGKNPKDFQYRRTMTSQMSQKLRISVKGTFFPLLYDTVTGEIKPVKYKHVGNETVISIKRYESDSILLQLNLKIESEQEPLQTSAKKTVFKTKFLTEKTDYTLSEPNVLVLDVAQLSFDGVHYEAPEELLRMDQALRKKMGYPMANGRDMQPWLIEEEEISQFPYLKFEFESEIETACCLAYEELTEVSFNGENVPIKREGHFVDHQIYTMTMPNIKKGRNELVLRVPFGKRVAFENFFLLGDFGVRVMGSHITVTALPQKLAFASLTQQGMPFYGGAVTYKTEFTLDSAKDIVVRAERYKGALIGLRIDGEDVGKIVFSPYTVSCKNVKAGTHRLELTLYGTRVNCFGALHNCGSAAWIGPDYWYSKGTDWSYEYALKDIGILKAPEIDIFEPSES